MKNRGWTIGLLLGALAAISCDAAQQDEGVMFECGEDMCLSSEEFCDIDVDCMGGSPSVHSCEPIEEMQERHPSPPGCEGNADEGFYCGTFLCG